MKVIYTQVCFKIRTKMHRLRIELRIELRKQLSKESVLHHEGWGPIRDQVQEQVNYQLKQNIVL